MEEDEEEEGDSQHLVSLPSLLGYLGTPGPADGGRSYNHSQEVGAVAPQAPGGGLQMDHPGFLGSNISLPAIIPAVQLVLRVVSCGTGAATSLWDTSSLACS